MYHSIPVGSDRSGSSGGFEPSAKLRARIKKLADWRLDPSCIFAGDTREFRGGHATVSKGWINTISDTHDRLDKSDWLEKETLSDWYYGWNIEVALKKMRIADDTDLERVLGLAIRESEFLAELSHPNIVRFGGFVEDISKNIIWLVFRWADNGNLKDFVALLDWEIPERISLINDVAQGLVYLHSREPPICHGDLKSLNVLVSWKRRAAITDFGSARRLSQRDPKTQIEQVESQRQSAQSLNATFCGSTNTVTLTGNKYTLRWAAPELLMDDRLSLWSDIWALGWIVYEVMTNSLPFQDALTDIVVVERVLGGDLPPLTENANLSVFHELCSLMTLCWRNNPTERPTADYCLESIKEMPMFVPEVDLGSLGDRSLAVHHLSDRHLPIHRLGDLGRMYQSRGEYARAFDFFVKAFEASRIHGNRQEVFSSLRCLAQFHRLRNEYIEAIVLYSEMGRAYDIRSEDLAEDLCNLAQLLQLRVEYNKAVKLSSQGRDTQEEERIAKVLLNLADGRRLQNQYNEAISLYSEVLEIRTSLHDIKGRAEALWGLADAYRLRREYEKAILLYSDALEIWADFGDRRGRASALWGLADVYWHGSEYDKAIPLYSSALEIWVDLGDRRGTASALWGLADVHRLRGEYSKAIPLYSQALEIRARLSDTNCKADTFWGLIDVHRHRSESDKDVPLYSDVLEIPTTLHDRKDRADALWALADVYRLRSEYNKAIPLYYEALEIWADLNDQEGRANALLGLASVQPGQDSWSDATGIEEKTSEIAEQVGDKEGVADALEGATNTRQLI